MKGKYKRKREHRLLIEKLSIPTENLGLPPVIVKLLQNMNLKTTKDIVSLTESEVRRLPRIGDARTRQIRNTLNELGLDFNQHETPPLAAVRKQVSTQAE